MAFAHGETGEHVRSTLGAVLRRVRESNERSLNDIAGPAGISPAFLSEVERGLKDISTDKLLDVCRSLQVTIGEVYQQLAHELGAGDPVWAVAWEADPRAQLRRMSQTLDTDSLRAVARFTTFLAMTEGAPRRRPIGFLR